MRRVRLGLGVAALLAATYGLLTAWTGTAEAADPCSETAKCPNLQARPAQDLSSAKIGNRTRLRFSTVTQNVGPGPLTLRGGEVVSGRSKQRVYQRIYDQDTPNGDYAELSVGEFLYHPQHRHFHLENYALYELIPADGANKSIQKRTSSKTSFCVQDTLKIDWSTNLPYGIDTTRNYVDCNGSLQGMSRGWADRYGYQLAGQEIDTTGLPDGSYTLRITVNPNRSLHETDTADNSSEVTVRLMKGLLPAP